MWRWRGCGSLSLDVRMRKGKGMWRRAVLFSGLTFRGKEGEGGGVQGFSRGGMRRGKREK